MINVQLLFVTVKVPRCSSWYLLWYKKVWYKRKQRKTEKIFFAIVHIYASRVQKAEKQKADIACMYASTPKSHSRRLVKQILGHTTLYTV